MFYNDFELKTILSIILGDNQHVLNAQISEENPEHYIFEIIVPYHERKDVSKWINNIVTVLSSEEIIVVQALMNISTATFVFFCVDFEKFSEKFNHSNLGYLN